MLDALKTIITHLTSASVTLKDLQPHLGTVVKTYSGNAHLKPQDTHFTHVDVVQRYQSEQVSHVEVTLATPIALKTLQNEFGVSQSVIPDDMGPEKAVFYLREVSKGKPSAIALIATLNDNGHDVDRITLRRDAQ